MESYSCSWQSPVKCKRGVITATDKGREWLLPWWWSRYQETNDLPVTFCDFGMSSEARLWCQERGEVVDVNPCFPVASRDQVDSETVKFWESLFWYRERVWDIRAAWLKKPFALLQSSYERGIWIDLDCEIFQSLDTAFDYCTTESQLGIVRELNHLHLPRFHPELIYNGGVIVFNHGASLIEDWAKKVVAENHLYLTDDRILSRVIEELRHDVVEMPQEYNLILDQLGVLKFDTVILHWNGEHGKAQIKKTGGLKPAFDEWRLIHRLPR